MKPIFNIIDFIGVILYPFLAFLAILASLLILVLTPPILLIFKTLNILDFFHRGQIDTILPFNLNKIRVKGAPKIMNYLLLNGLHIPILYWGYLSIHYSSILMFVIIFSSFSTYPIFILSISFMLFGVPDWFLDTINWLHIGLTL